MSLNMFDLCKEIASQGLVKCSSGNLSVRINKEHYYITTSGSWFERMDESLICQCRISDGEQIGDGFKPSSENEIHWKTLLRRPDVNVVLHCQPVCATAIGCLDLDDNDPLTFLNLIPEIPYYIGNVSMVPYYRPGSKELTSSIVLKFSKGSNLVIAKNHGIFVVGKDYDEVLQRVCFFELACSVYLTARTDTVSLSDEQINELKDMRKVKE